MIFAETILDVVTEIAKRIFHPHCFRDFEPQYILLIISSLAIVFALFFYLSKKTIFVSAKVLKYILALCIIYISLPSVLFILSLHIAVVVKLILCGLVLYYTYKAMKGVFISGVISDRHGYYLRMDIACLCIGLVIVSYFSLLYGRGFNFDWPKHRSILLCLYNNPLDPTLDGFNTPHSSNLSGANLVYYYAMYLPSVYTAKILSIFFTITNIKILAYLLTLLFSIWNFLGLLLAFSLMPVCCNKIFKSTDNRLQWGYFYLSILIFSGLKFWCRILPIEKFRLGECISLSYFAYFNSFILFWTWIPSQLVAGLLGVVLLLIYKDRLEFFSLCLWSTFLISSSAFCWIGSVPIILYVACDRLFRTPRQNFRYRCRQIFKKMSAEIVVTSVICLITIFFYLSKQYPEVLSINRSLLRKSGLTNYMQFHLVELGPVLMILLTAIKRKILIPAIAWLAVGLFLVLSVFELGAYNELFSRASIPAFCVLMIVFSYVVQHVMSDRSLVRRLPLIILLIALGVSFINDYIYGLRMRSVYISANSQFAYQYAGKPQMK
ncbi:hypothetical protein ACFL0T_05040 [Candidatus Omnitrophota bacterium]